MEKGNRTLKRILSVITALLIVCICLFIVVPRMQGRDSGPVDTNLTFANVVLNTEMDLQNELENKTMRHDYNTETNYYEYFGIYRVYIPDTWSNADPYFRPDSTAQLRWFERNYVSRIGFFSVAKDTFEGMIKDAGYEDFDLRHEYRYILKEMYVSRFVFTAVEDGQEKLFTADLVRKPDGNGMTILVYSENTDAEYSSLADYNEILQGMEIR